jgi:hypothetical protein
MPRKSKLVALDFHEHDTIDALRLLLEMAKDGKISGMVFGVIQKRGERPLFGSTGQLASDQVAAVGVAAILEDQLSQPFLACSK